MGGSCLFRIDTSHHLGVIVESLLGLESSLDERISTWLPVIPWQITLVFLLTHTLGVVLNIDVITLENMIDVNIYIVV